LWSEVVDQSVFEASDGETRVNVVLAYSAQVIAEFGECATRHDALVDRNNG
jgi:hypothetical protein